MIATTTWTKKWTTMNLQITSFEAFYNPFSHLWPFLCLYDPCSFMDNFLYLVWNYLCIILFLCYCSFLQCFCGVLEKYCFSSKSLWRSCSCCDLSKKKKVAHVADFLLQNMNFLKPTHKRKHLMWETFFLYSVISSLDKNQSFSWIRRYHF